MISNTVCFSLTERVNCHRKSGKEWALSAQLGSVSWTIKTWEKEPAEKTVEDVKELAMRCFELYHVHLQIPRFNLKREDV